MLGYFHDRRDAKRPTRRGLSLLEVILALAILALSMAAIGELIRIGTISASQAEEYTQAQILADSKLSEIMSGAITADPVTRVQFPAQPDWYYTIELATTEQTEVMALRVTVETHIKRARPLAFSLTRWIPDPGIELPEETEEPEEPESESESEEEQPEEETPPPEVPNGNNGNNGGNIPNLPNGLGQGGRG